MNDDDLWYYGSIYDREPSTVRVARRTPDFLTLDNGKRVKINGDSIVYRASKVLWFEWKQCTLRRKIEAKRIDMQRLERDLVETETRFRSCIEAK